MLHYWRTTAAIGGGAATFFTGKSSPPTSNNQPIPAASPFSDYGFDGPFFDLEFALSNHDASETSQKGSGSVSGDMSESDDELTEIELNFDDHDHDHFVPEENSKASVSLLKSAEKFRVLLLKLKKPDSSTERSEKGEAAVRVRFKVDEVKGQLISLFARDYSISEQKATNLGKEMMQKYLNILKPLYIGVEKMKNSGQMRFYGGGGAVSPPPELGGSRRNNLQAGFEVVRKHLGKSRSSSTAGAAVVLLPAMMGSHRYDESVQDGIQGAILHCKRSFNSNMKENYVGSVNDL